MLVSISPNYVAYTFERKNGEMFTVFPNSVPTIHLKCFLVERFNSETNKKFMVQLCFTNSLHVRIILRLEISSCSTQSDSNMNVSFSIIKSDFF